MPLTETEDTLRQELFERWIPFFEIEHVDLLPSFTDGILGLVLDNKPWTVDFGGPTSPSLRSYSPAPFEPSLLTSEPDRPAQAVIEIFSFEEAIRAIRLLQTAPQVRLFLALESDLSMVPVPKQREASGFSLAVTYDALRIQIPISPVALEDEAQSRHQFTPRNNPSLFGVSA